MRTFVFRLKAPRETVALDMTDEEREIISRHAAQMEIGRDGGGSRPPRLIVASVGG
jgi:hypothetical protein